MRNADGVSWRDETSLGPGTFVNKKIYYRKHPCCTDCFCCSDCYPHDFDAQGLETQVEKDVNEGMGIEACGGNEAQRVTSEGSFHGHKGCMNDFGCARDEVRGNQS